MKIVEKFAKLVKEKYNIELDIDSFRRTYAGYWQRSLGAWSWSMCKKDRHSDVGSQWNITELLKNKESIDFDGEEFYPKQQLFD